MTHLGGEEKDDDGGAAAAMAESGERANMARTAFILIDPRKKRVGQIFIIVRD